MRSRAVREGRRVGSRLNAYDVMSPYAQRKKKIKVGRLDHFEKDEGIWKEILVEDRTCTPADLAASRIDFRAWLKTLSHRKRQIAEGLATREAPSLVARRFNISRGRVSQIRRELFEAWHRFHGELPPYVALARG